MPLLGSASAALVVAGLLAQAEPAPPEADPGAPAAAAPSTASAVEEPARKPDSVAVYGRLATRPAGPDAGVSREGFSIGAAFERRWGGLSGGHGGALGFGVGLDFFFDHFTGGGTQHSFVALQTVALERLPVRPYVAVGAGLAVVSSARPVARGVVGVELPLPRATAIAVRADLTHALSGDGALADLVDVGVGLVQRF
jgi:hypothetical protein